MHPGLLLVSVEYQVALLWRFLSVGSVLILEICENKKTFIQEIWENIKESQSFRFQKLPGSVVTIYLG